jgi:hypothetical protein
MRHILAPTGKDLGGGRESERVMVVVETVIDPVVLSEALFKIGEAVSWSQRLKEN